jgi:hypothetical protein
LYSSIGVGTVMMKTRQDLRSSIRVVKLSRFASRSSGPLTSSVLSRPRRSSAIRAGLMSKPTVP